MSENNDIKQYEKDFSDEGFWEKVKKYAKKAGSEVIEKALMLYYCFQDSDTPLWAKSVIIAALGYFISPVDAIPDVIPGVGYVDDLGALAAAIASVAVHIKEEHKNKAKELLSQWFD
ncbi:YkvA family protein [Bibersteinia trehalosi]|uniref:YkvA family protein n=1 Tax=Bibersteinia trehalosi TaxID=47735 RepID=UPI0040463A3B